MCHSEIGVEQKHFLILVWIEDITSSACSQATAPSFPQTHTRTNNI